MGSDQDSMSNSSKWQKWKKEKGNVQYERPIGETSSMVMAHLAIEREQDRIEDEQYDKEREQRDAQLDATLNQKAKARENALTFEQYVQQTKKETLENSSCPPLRQLKILWDEKLNKKGGRRSSSAPPELRADPIELAERRPQTASPSQAVAPPAPIKPRRNTLTLSGIFRHTKKDSTSSTARLWGRNKV